MTNKTIDTHLIKISKFQFIKKTYSHLFGAILAFVVLETILFQSGIAYAIARSILSVSWLWVLAVYMIVSWLASHFALSQKSISKQYLGLITFIAAEAIIFTPLLYIAQRKSGIEILGYAGAITLLAFSGLTWLVLDTKKDFSFLEMTLKWGGICALVIIIAGVLFSFELGLFFAIAMVAFSGLAILYDTSKILHHFDEDQYVAAALHLFSSVGLMFWYVIQILMSKK